MNGTRVICEKGARKLCTAEVQEILVKSMTCAGSIGQKPQKTWIPQSFVTVLHAPPNLTRYGFGRVLWRWRLCIVLCR